MSHELRTPLNAILGYTELMQDGLYGELPTKTTEVLDRVQKNGKHLLGLINDVLDLSKIEAGQLVLGIEGYSMQDVVLDCGISDRVLGCRQETAPQGRASKDMPSGQGDERRIAQVLLNLVGNAIKFTDAGEVRIAAKAANGMFRVAVVERVRVFRTRSKHGYSMSSIRSTAPTPRRKAAPGSASPSPSASSSCTVGEFGWNRRWARDPRFSSSYLSGPSNGGGVA